MRFRGLFHNEARGSGSPTSNPPHRMEPGDETADMPPELPWSSVPRALTIAGSDSGAGAGIQADLKTFAALGVYGLSAITAITAQNTQGVRAVEEISPAVVEAQIDAVMEDIGADAAKTGMLASPAILEGVA